MTTTFYPPYHIGGDAIHVYHLSNELARLGHEVHVIHSIDSYHWQRKGKPIHKYPNHENVTVHSISSPIGKISPLISYIFGSPFPVTRKIQNVINEVKPDILHHHNIAGLGPFILNNKASKVLYTAHDYWLICPMNGLMRYDRTYCKSSNHCKLCTLKSGRPVQLWRCGGKINKYIKNVDTIITPSNFMKDKLQEFGLRGNFITIPNFVPEPPKADRQLYEFPYFVFVGVLEEHKGILNLIYAFQKAKDEVDSKLLIIGSGSLAGKINDFIIKNECTDRIIMLGRIDDFFTLANIYANALAVIIPSVCAENCPMVAMEALANGTPIITSNEGGLPEIINNIGFGSSMLLQTNSIENLSLAIQKASSMSQVSNSTSIERKSFEMNYSVEAYMEKYEILIKG